MIRKALLLAGILAAASLAPAAPVTVSYTDPAGYGFNETTLNGGRPVGELRREATDYMARVWGARLGGNQPIVISASCDNLGGSGGGAVLAFAGPNNFILNPPGAPVATTYYAQSLANQLANTNYSGSELSITFNIDVDNATVLGSADWYYGLDENPPGSDVSWVRTGLHELGHGLGFTDTVNSSNGALAFGNPTIYDRQLQNGNPGTALTALTNGGRLTAITSNAVYWLGTNANTTLGTTARMYAPNPYQGGSSMSHWDPAIAGSELMEPAIGSDKVALELTDDAMKDMGYTLLGPTVLPVMYWLSTTATSIAEGGAAATYTVRLTGAATTQNSVAVVKLTGSATYGTDYTITGPDFNPTTQTVTLTSPATSTVLTINPLADGGAESTETIVMRITGISGAGFPTTNSNITINLTNTVSDVPDWSKY